MYVGDSGGEPVVVGMVVAIGAAVGGAGERVDLLEECED